MRQHLLASLTLLLAGPVFAQFAADDRLEPPKTPAEYWRAMNFEINTGKYDSAAFYLKGFLAVPPTEQDLVELEQKDGLASFLRLRNITWSADAKANGDAKKNAEDAITRVNAALEKMLGNQQRINRLVASLQGSEDERAFAISELQRTGARAIPALVMSLRGDADPSHRAAIFNTLRLLPEDTVAPLLAALDINDGRIRYQILESLGQRVDFTLLPSRPETNPLPSLDYLSASPKQPEDVRRLAATLITRLRSVARTEIRPAKQELTEAALKFYRHQERFIKPDAVAVWRWENDDLTMTVSTLTQAEEYFGLRYARWALELDPNYLPAQVAFLSIATDNAFGRVGVAADLEKTDPTAHSLLATAGPTALIAALDQAIIDRRTPVALAITQALGERADAKAAQSSRYKPGVLVQALSYPDRRVQLAAAAALVRIPGPYALQNQTKIVEILRRALAAESEVSAATSPRILVGHFDAAKGKDLVAMFKEAGFDAIAVRTGRELMSRLQRASDIDGLAIDSELPNPQLPDLLADLRADTFAKALPVRVLYSPAPSTTYPSVMMETRLHHATPQTVAIRNDEERTAFDAANRMKFIVDGQPRVTMIRSPLTPAVLKASFAQDVGADGPPLTAEERKQFASTAIELFRQIALSQPGIDLKPADRAIRQSLKSDELGKVAIDVVGRLSGRDSQLDLASLTLDNARPVALRLAAANNLALHIQRFGAVLPRIAVEALTKLANEAKEPELRGQVAAVVGVLSGEGKTTGTRLQGYVPPKPGIAAKEPAAEEKKPEPNPEKKPDPDDE
jgi:hypothetical protein